MRESVALIQARMGSARLPGKMMMTLGEYPILEWVLSRVKRSKLIAKTILCTTNLECDDVLVDLAKKMGVEVFRGDENDVVGRFLAALSGYGFDNVVRVCADNPFVEPIEIDRLISFFNSSKFDYACNHQDRLGSKYSDGFGAEIFSLNALKSLATNAIEIRHREHVTLYFWENANQYKIGVIPAPVGYAYPELRFDIDVANDLEKLERLICLGISVDTPGDEIISTYLNNSAYINNL